MTDVRTQLEAVFEKLATVISEPGDYIDPASGLLRCGKCHTPKQCSVEVLGKMRVLPCICRCEHERHEAEEAARKERDRLDRVRRLKANGLQDKALLAYTFDLDDGTNPAMRYARNYVAHWQELPGGERGEEQGGCCRVADGGKLMLPNALNNTTKAKTQEKDSTDKMSEHYGIILPQPTIESFARLLVPELRKYYSAIRNPGNKPKML